MSRLEEIKKQRQKKSTALDYIDLDIDWLISRVEELEDKLEFIKTSRNRSRETILRYKQALEFYADEYNWHEENVGGTYLPYYESDASRDGGEKARKALKGEHE